jgi:hypothetical protein
MDLIIPIVRREPFDDPAWLFDPSSMAFAGWPTRSMGVCSPRPATG